MGSEAYGQRVVRRSAAVALLLALLTAVGAQAAQRFERCERNPYLRCADVRVPLDRSGDLPGTIKLHVERLPGLSRRNPGAIVALAGGPGQSATAAFGEDFYPHVEPALRGRNLILFDQRGTGLSGVIRCPRFERVLNRTALALEAREAEACAERIGPRRAFYTTRDSVEDLEAVRRAIGVPRISIYGVSYGSKVALAYAMKYPQNVERLLLDSIQEPAGPDPLYRDTFAAVPRALGALCGATCPFTPDPGADVAELVRRLGEGPLRGQVYDSKGRPRDRELTRLDLFFLLLGGDFDLSLRAATPAAIRSALNGDAAPLLRLTMPAIDVRAGPKQPLPFASALFATTICEEAPMPWDRTTPVDQRMAIAAERVAALPESAFYPFDRASVLETEFLRICSRWPHAPEAPALTGAPPEVPTLLLNGQDDLRTPVEEARRVAAALPNAALVEVPATGHAVLADPADCVKRAVRNFFAGRSVSTGCSHPRFDPPLEIAPVSLDEVEPAPGTSDQPGRTVAAVGLTVRDVNVQANYFSSGGGLRGGSWQFRQRFVLDRVVYVPGVEVSGSLRYTVQGELLGRVRVRGEAATAGTLLLSRGGRVTGTLGGQAIDTRVDLDDTPEGADAAVRPRSVLSGP